MAAMLFVVLSEGYLGITCLLSAIFLFFADNVIMARAIEQLYFFSFRLAIIVDDCKILLVNHNNLNR